MRCQRAGMLLWFSLRSRSRLSRRLNTGSVPSAESDSDEEAQLEPAPAVSRAKSASRTTGGRAVWCSVGLGIAASHPSVLGPRREWRVGVPPAGPVPASHCSQPASRLRRSSAVGAFVHVCTRVGVRGRVSMAALA